jgi:SAM-dependent methyltransferase
MTVVDPGQRGRVELERRYTEADLGVFTREEARRFQPLLGDAARGYIAAELARELLYRLEPSLYDRWARAEAIHPGILAWLPADIEVAVEVAAGSGRLTLQLARRCAELWAIEPAAPMRELLTERLVAGGHDRVRVRPGFFDAIPMPSGAAQLVVSCSALTPDPAHGGEAGLREMERVCAPGGVVALVWPNNLEWLGAQGYEHVSFPGRMLLEFPTVDDAAELAAIFYPGAVAEITRRRDRRVPYEVVGINPPRDLAFRRMSG